MGARYLTDLAQVCRRSGYPVIEVDGWKTRARGSGGYDTGRPTHLMAHHTASGPGSDGWPDVNYCTYGDDDAPLCNLYLNRTGTIWVCAGGATNTNGSGHDPCGVTPDDSMNSHAIGIEAGNNGVGERWPDAQLDSYLRLCDALCEHYDIPVTRIHAHFEWAPARKTDPAGPVRYAPSGVPWNMAAFRADVAEIAEPPPEPPTTEEDPMFIAAASSHWWVGNGLHYRRLDGPAADSEIAVWVAAGTPLKDRRSGKPITAKEQVSAIAQSSIDAMGVRIE